MLVAPYPLVDDVIPRERFPESTSVEAARFGLRRVELVKKLAERVRRDAPPGCLLGHAGTVFHFRAHHEGPSHGEGVEHRHRHAFRAREEHDDVRAGDSLEEWAGPAWWRHVQPILHPELGHERLQRIHLASEIASEQDDVPTGSRRQGSHHGFESLLADIEASEVQRDPIAVGDCELAPKASRIEDVGRRLHAVANDDHRALNTEAAYLRRLHLREGEDSCRSLQHRQLEQVPEQALAERVIRQRLRCIAAVGRDDVRHMKRTSDEVVAGAEHAVQVDKIRVEIVKNESGGTAEAKGVLDGNPTDSDPTRLRVGEYLADRTRRYAETQDLDAVTPRCERTRRLNDDGQES